MKYLLITDQNFRKSNFYFFTFSADSMSSIFYKYMFMLIKQNNDTQIVFNFIIC